MAKKKRSAAKSHLGTFVPLLSVCPLVEAACSLPPFSIHPFLLCLSVTPFCRFTSRSPFGECRRVCYHLFQLLCNDFFPAMIVACARYLICTVIDALAPFV